jgi:hypothetical protein
MADAKLHEAIELVKSQGFEVVNPADRLPTTIERPATSPAEMDTALSQSIPGGDLSMASQAGLALAVGSLTHRVTLLEDRLSRLASVLVGDPAAGQEKPDHIEHEPEPITEPEREGTDPNEDEILRDRGYEPVERAADGLPKEV